MTTEHTNQFHTKPASAEPVISMFKKAGITLDENNLPITAQMLGAIIECYSAAILNTFVPGIAPKVGCGIRVKNNTKTIEVHSALMPGEDWGMIADDMIEEASGGFYKTHQSRQFGDIPYLRRRYFTHGKHLTNLSTCTFLKWFIGDVDPNDGNFLAQAELDENGEIIGYDFKSIDTGMAFHFPELDLDNKQAETLFIDAGIFTSKGLSDYLKNRALYQFTGNQRDLTGQEQQVKFSLRETYAKEQNSAVLSQSYSLVGFSKLDFYQDEIDDTARKIIATSKDELWKTAAPYEEKLNGLREILTKQLGEGKALLILGPENNFFDIIMDRKQDVEGYFKDIQASKTPINSPLDPKKRSLQACAREQSSPQSNKRAMLSHHSTNFQVGGV